MMRTVNHIFTVGFGLSTVIYASLALASGQHAWMVGAGISVAGTAVALKKTDVIALISGKS